MSNLRKEKHNLNIAKSVERLGNYKGNKTQEIKHKKPFELNKTLFGSSFK